MDCVLKFGCYILDVWRMPAKNGTSPRAIVRDSAISGKDDSEELFMLKPSVNRRPAKTLKDLEEQLKKENKGDWREIMLSAACRGDGSTSWLVYLGLNNHSLNSLLRDEPEFHDFYQQCILIKMAWNENAGKRIMLSGKGNAQVWQMTMVNDNKWKTSNNLNEMSGGLNIEKTDKIKIENLTNEQIETELKKRGFENAELFNK